MTSTIRPIEAQELVENSGWIYGNDAVSYMQHFQEIIPLDSNTLKDLNFLKNVGSNNLLVNDITNSAHKYLRETSDHKYIEQPEDDPLVAAFRIKEYWVYKLGSSSPDILLRFLSLVCVSAVLTPITGPIAWLSVSVSFGELIRTLMNAFERLEDSAEKLVFEAIFKLERRPQIINYDAYESKDFSRAYGNVWPTELEIREELSEVLSETQVNESLLSMKSRKILDKNSGKWRIRI